MHLSDLMLVPIFSLDYRHTRVWCGQRHARPLFLPPPPEEVRYQFLVAEYLRDFVMTDKCANHVAAHFILYMRVSYVLIWSKATCFKMEIISNHSENTVKSIIWPHPCYVHKYGTQVWQNYTSFFFCTSRSALHTWLEQWPCKGWLMLHDKSTLNIFSVCVWWNLHMWVPFWHHFWHAR